MGRRRRAGLLDPQGDPRHLVHVEAFRIMRYPVTNLEYRVFLEDTGLDVLPTSWELGCYPVHRANHPVWAVRPEHADAYAGWLAARTGRAFRLPTEAEWEYAAGGGDIERSSRGARLPQRPREHGRGGPLTTTPVGIYPAGRSVFGADDMAGNVEEFVADDYAAYPGGAEVADDLTADGSYRVARAAASPASGTWPAARGDTAGSIARSTRSASGWSRGGAMTVASGHTMAVNLDVIGDRQAMRLPPQFEGRCIPEALGGHVADLLGNP
ncbi:formylglycine-generating enzyme family protein [Streptomyces sp. M10(2022)]